MWIQPNKVRKKITQEEFFIVVKHMKDCSKVRTNGALGKFTFKNGINLQFLAISLHFFCLYLTNCPSWIRIRIQKVKRMRILDDLDPQPWFALSTTAPICVVNDYTDTRFLRISSRRRKRSQNSFLSVHMGPRWRFLIKKV